MSEWVAYAGGALLTAATVPQAWRLVRTRDASGFAWGFVAMNVAGILLLAYRSWEIGERAFLILNLTTAAFWALVAALKLPMFQGAGHKRLRRRAVIAPHADG